MAEGQKDTGRRVLFSAQKNEGPFILEWVAYHKVIGFTDIIVVSNDCDDGSDALLDALARSGKLIHIPQTVPAGTAPQMSAERLAREASAFRTGDWVMWLDLDEFLVPAEGLDNLILKLENMDGVALNWCLMGDNGQDGLPDRFVCDRFTAAAKRHYPPHQTVKTLFRWDERVERLDLHRPLWDPDATAVRVLNGRGAPLDKTFLYEPIGNGNPRARVALERGIYRLGQVNHYSVRTRALYDLKQSRGRGAAPGKNVRHTEELFHQLNRSDREERRILAFADATTEAMARLRAHSGVAEADAACRAQFARRLGQAS